MKPYRPMMKPYRPIQRQAFQTLRNALLSDSAFINPSQRVTVDKTLLEQLLALYDTALLCYCGKPATHLASYMPDDPLQPTCATCLSPNLTTSTLPLSTLPETIATLLADQQRLNALHSHMDKQIRANIDALFKPKEQTLSPIATAGNIILNTLTLIFSPILWLFFFAIALLDRTIVPIDPPQADLDLTSFAPPAQDSPTHQPPQPWKQPTAAREATNAVADLLREL